METIKQSKFSKLSNLIFLTFTTFALSFIWINYYIKSIKYAFISSIIIALCFFTLYIVFKYYQNKIYIKVKNKHSKIEELKLYFLYSNYKELINTLQKIFNLNNLTKTEKPNHYIDNINNKDIYFMFDKENMCSDDIINIYKTKNCNNIDIYCINTTDNYTELENINLNIINLEKINTTLIEKNIKFNSTILLKKKPKLSAKEVLRIILNKNKSRSYFLWGFALIIISVFTPYYLYYNITGSSLLLLSLYSRFNKQFN